jgi:hypothetical protein
MDYDSLITSDRDRLSSERASLNFTGRNLNFPSDRTETARYEVPVMTNHDGIISEEENSFVSSHSSNSDKSEKSLPPELAYQKIVNSMKKREINQYERNIQEINQGK